MGKYKKTTIDLDFGGEYVEVEVEWDGSFRVLGELPEGYDESDVRSKLRDWKDEVKRMKGRRL